MKKWTVILLAALFLFGLSSAASAIPFTGIKNASFDDQVLADGAFAAGIQDWETFTYGKGIGTWNPAGDGSGFFNSPIPDGPNVAYLNGAGWLYQDLDLAITAGTTYTLNAWVGDRNDTDLPTSWGVALRGAGANLDLAVAATTSIPVSGGWELVEASFTAAAGLAELGEDLRVILYASSNSQINFDKVSLDVASSPVPEPATMLLLGAGLMGLAGFGRKKIRK